MLPIEVFIEETIFFSISSKFNDDVLYGDKNLVDLKSAIFWQIDFLVQERLLNTMA